ncbi:MAG: 23S rRNA pseudouridine(1911/1915/1917) synthase RluD, partial [Gammaproteobacteria bacterium]|nr:23S rRNA pseudouridine(1911/1915/1917) synthase RluD [Gammaproteobacteria bacterium]
MKILQQQLSIDDKTSGLRLDQALSQLLPEYSRSKIQDWIKQGFITLNDSNPKPREKVYSGDRLQLDIPQTIKTYDQPQAIEFGILYQDDALFVIDKPAGLVVHPAAGHQAGTLVNGLLHRDPALQQLPRAGIVHRLDKDTSGVMVVARNLQAHSALVEALQQRDVKREYVAIAQGVITAGRTIEQPIARHPADRKRMAVRPDGKEAITRFSVRERFRAHSLIDVQLQTGRTHQIRVHMAYLHHPLVGDPVYGGRLSLPKGISPGLEQVLRNFKRQALHAWRLSFQHPLSGEAMSFAAELPTDMQQLIEV